MKILIAIPCMEQVAAEFAQSLATLNKCGECAVSFIIGSLIYDSRNKLVKQALAAEADVIVFFDSDMVFSSDTLERLVKHIEDGKQVVSGLYFKRRPPYTPVLYKSLEANGKAEDFVDYPVNSVFKVEGCGFGCVAITTEALYKMALCCNNWFEPLEHYGEDLSFCYRAKQCGIEIYCDSSIKLGHVGHAVITEEAYQILKG